MSHTETTQATVIRPRTMKWHGKLAATLAYGAIRAVGATLRHNAKDDSGLLEGVARKPVIFATWHNRLALSLMVYRVFVQRANKSRRMAAIVSASRDGGIVARVLQHFGVEPVRGSSSRRGPQALLELTTLAEQGFDIAITPDGPRGPRYVVQEGVIALARVTGLPIIPVSDRLGWKFALNSWDQFQIPFPFSTWDVHFGEPIRVPREADDQEREALRLRLENALKSMTRD